MPLVELSVLPKHVFDEDYLLEQVASSLNLAKERIKAFPIRRRSIDARARQPLYRLQLEVFVDQLPPVDVKRTDKLRSISGKEEVLVVGAGPAGYFAALELIELGLKPVILERGKDVRARRFDLKAIQQEGIVNPDSNYCFGEGGAGTYSDGKLYTRSKKRGKIIKVLELLVEHGATSDILIDAHPHIGSNKLPKVVANIRETILKYGGEIHFDSKVTDFILDQQTLKGVVVNNGERSFLSKAVILATGHSARGIFELLHNKDIRLEAKPFALGVRIEHPQALIDQVQYKQNPREENLPASSYKLACQVKERGVFSFCMCPGGLIVPASTAPEELVVNGMSMSRRDSAFANSGLVVAVELEDLKAYNKDGVFAALAFQKAVEKRFFDAGDGSQKAPAQKVTDFVKNKMSSKLNDTSYIPGIYSADFNQLLPKPIASRLQVGVQEFGKKMKGYFSEDAQLIGVESRTSSPVRIPRNKDTTMHPEISGLFPCGEGAGYAGGIVSAAMDGQNVAKAIGKYVFNI